MSSKVAHYKAYNGKVLQGEDTIKRHKMPQAKYSAFVLFVPFVAISESAKRRLRLPRPRAGNPVPDHSGRLQPTSSLRAGPESTPPTGDLPHISAKHAGLVWRHTDGRRRSYRQSNVSPRPSV